jgi:hypothetical protein
MTMTKSEHKMNSFFPPFTQSELDTAVRIVEEVFNLDIFVEKTAAAISGAWRDGCETGLRNQAEEATFVIMESGLGDQEQLKRLAKYVSEKLWSDGGRLHSAVGRRSASAASSQLESTTTSRDDGDVTPTPEIRE